jgi:hypothetical protein
MAVLKASEARARLYRLIDETAASHQPVLIPGMRESIIKGLKTHISECAEEIEG